LITYLIGQQILEVQVWYIKKLSDREKVAIKMISEHFLANEFINVVDRVHPKIGDLLDKCYVKVIEFSVKRLRKRFHYIAIYCPDRLICELQAHKSALKDVAENMGLVDVSCINATKLIHDPLSQIKQENPRFWLELYWISVDGKSV